MNRTLKIIVAIMLLVLFIVSCSVDHLCHLEVTMKNTLPMDLKIQVVKVNPSESSNTETNTFTIPSRENTSFVFDYLKQIDYPVYFDDNQCDSMRVIFNDSVQIVFSREDKSKFNPILMENYESLPTQNSWDGCLQYIFTEEDYQNALNK